MTRQTLENAIAGITEEQACMFMRFYELLMEWNKKMNLTAITDEQEVVYKHFADSIAPMGLIKSNASCIDVGTGAGFPGIPLMIMRSDIKLTLLDSLNKRLIFINEVLRELGLSQRAVTLHARCEDAARMDAHRDRYDIALSRAVASAPVLIEWTAPFVKTGGMSLMYKGVQADEELRLAKNALDKLNCTAQLISYNASWGDRYVIAAKKLKPTPKAYPRKAGTASKNPL